MPLRLAGDQAKLVARKVTLDTGEVPFWEALDQLCAKAGLVGNIIEKNSLELPPADMNLIRERNFLLDAPGRGSPGPAPAGRAGSSFRSGPGR